MKNLIIMMLLMISTGTQAQVSKISMQASGLTCSMCSNSINKAIGKLDFVEKVMSNIKTSTFEISFKPDAKIDFDAIKKKVEDAGFFVSKFVVTMQFDDHMVANDQHINANGNTLHFLNVKSQQLKGVKDITFLDKGFVSDKVYKKNAGLTKMACYKSGKAESCCEKEGLVKGSRIFHVTI